MQDHSPVVKALTTLASAVVDSAHAMPGIVPLDGVGFVVKALLKFGAEIPVPAEGMSAEIAKVHRALCAAHRAFSEAMEVPPPRTGAQSRLVPV